MKILKAITIILCLTIIFAKNDSTKSKSLSSSNLKKEKSTDVIDNFPDMPLHGIAVTNDNFLLQQTAGFKNAEIMDKIPRHINNNLNTGIIEKASTFVTDKFYYNGRDNINAIHIDCNVFSTNAGQCVNNSGCGWCGQSNTCVSGTSSGPLSPCLRGTYLFTAPSREWNPIKASHINTLAINARGEPLNHIVPEPDMSKVDVFNPYK